MSKMIWLSFPLDVAGPRPPAISAPSLSTLYTIEKDAAAVQILTVANHTGTHVDAPAHVIAGGLRVEDFGPKEFVFSHPAVVDLPLGEAAVAGPEDLAAHEQAMKGADLVLFRFGYGKLRREQPGRFNERCPGFGVEAARWLRGHLPGMRAIGMDVPSAACIAHLTDTMACHNELLGGRGRRFLIVEDMDLEKDLCGLVEVRLWPWLVHDMDSGPCAAVGIVD